MPWRSVVERMVIQAWFDVEFWASMGLPEPKSARINAKVENKTDREFLMARVAIVTGGTRGIGAAISVRLKEAGMKVAASYVGNDERARVFSAETGISVYKFDVADFEA